MFPFRLCASDPNWVPPLISDRVKHFDPYHHPFFEHAEVQLFRAVRDGVTVGTIAAIADEVHPRVWNEPVGFFGEFEVIEGYAVAAKLFAAAREWLAQRGLRVMRGPMNLSINDECSLLIDGFDGPPVIMMTYNPRYYPSFFERYGFVKAKDFYAYRLDIASYGPNLEYLPEQVRRVARIARERFGVTMRHVDMKNFDTRRGAHHAHSPRGMVAELGRLADVRRRVPPPGGESPQGRRPELTYLAFIGDEPIGCFVALPDLNRWPSTSGAALSHRLAQVPLVPASGSRGSVC